MACYGASSGTVARYVDEIIKPRLTRLKSDLRREFRAADARQQAQLDRVEKKLDRLLELFEPRVIDKPAVAAASRAITKKAGTP